jgi:hypothetical protein
MTKREITNIRSLEFSAWVRSKLPDSSIGFSASDLDFIFWNWRVKTIMFVEIKTRSKQMAAYQRIMWATLDDWIKKGKYDNWKYYGFYLIEFENSWFDNGKCFLTKIEFGNKTDKTEISENELITFLSMKP